MALSCRAERGVSIVEALVASSIIAVSIVGLFSAWIGIFARHERTREVAVAGGLARAEIERAKVFGIGNLPYGAYSSASGTATWTGSYNPSPTSGLPGWISGGQSYYGMTGNRLQSSAGAVFSMLETFTDSNVIPSSGGYSYNSQSEKAMVVSVSKTIDGSVIFVGATILVEGGL